MRLKKIGPITFGSRVRDTLSCVFVTQTVVANLIHLRYETTNKLQLKGYYQNSPPSPHSRKKKAPMLRSQKTQKTPTPLKTGSEPYFCSYFLLDSGPLIYFRWINLKLSLTQHNNVQHTREI